MLSAEKWSRRLVKKRGEGRVERVGGEGRGGVRLGGGACRGPIVCSEARAEASNGNSMLKTSLKLLKLTKLTKLIILTTLTTLFVLAKLAILTKHLIAL